MKNFVLILTMVLGIYSLVNAQFSTSPACTFCTSNQIGDSSSALGFGNVSTGLYSLGSGYYNQATGDYSQAFGNLNTVSNFESFAAGYNNSSNGIASICLGTECSAHGKGAFAAGLGSIANGLTSFAFGQNVMTGESTSTAFVIGEGNNNSAYLVNDISHSLMIGFTSTKPTFFVGQAPGYNKTGRIGIGNITAPEAKLHIKADNDEDASLLLQPTGSTYFGKLMLGDENHSISSRTDENLEFKTQTDKDFVFKNGSIFIEDQFSGLILKSPDGQCWKRTVDNNGNFVIENINCNLMTNEKKNPEAPQQTARIFPNPASHKLSIELSSGISQAYARFYNETGILLLQKELKAGNNSISLRKMPLGVLVVKVSDEKGNLLSVEKVMHQ